MKTACVYTILDDLYDPDRGFLLSTAWPGVRGIYSTEYACGHDFDLASEEANRMNKENGIDSKVAREAVEQALGLSEIIFYRT